MNFWKKSWKLVSKKDLIFGSLLFGIVIVMSFVDSANKVKVDLGNTAAEITSSRYSMNIPYDLIDSVALAELSEAGEALDGFDDMTIRTGSWKNDIWGEYCICADLDATNCILFRLSDGRLFVISQKDNETTQSIYEALLTRLPAP